MEDSKEFICNKCGNTYKPFNDEEAMKCPFCGAEDVNINKETDLPEWEDFEEKEYICENCSESFMSYPGDKIVCPVCNYVQVEPVAQEVEGNEPDYEPTDEEWEDIQFGDE
jgi:DNA-directed RNA polymerase subunit RPC12/RpoP